MAAKSEQIFAANRAFGSVSLSVKRVAGKTRRAQVHEAGSLRVRCPGAPAEELEAVLINTAGGVAGGDTFTLDIAAGEGTQLVVTTAAAEKVYRSLGPDSTIDVKLAVATGASLAWLPQETILFDRARLSRSIEVDLASDARLFLAEAVVFGRTGMGETVEQGALSDRWRIRRDGRLIYAESVRLDGAIAKRLARTAVAKGGIAVATVLMAARRRCRGRCGARAGRFRGRGRRIRLERHRGGAPVRSGWRGVTARSDPCYDRDARCAAAHLDQLTEILTGPGDESDAAREGQAADFASPRWWRGDGSNAASSSIIRSRSR